MTNLQQLSEHILETLTDSHHAREVGLAASRRVIQLSSRAIRAMHRGEFESSQKIAAEAEEALREAQSALEACPRIRYAGFLHDAEKEYAEARLVLALRLGQELKRPHELGVEVPAWFNGLCEAASELRRTVLDTLRKGEMVEAEGLLERMDEVYDVLVKVDFPDAITGGLRRSTDAYRAVLERTRSDLTTAVLQENLRRAMAEHS